MALLDSAFRDLAKTLLTVMGVSATLKRVTPGTYSPISGESGTPTETEYSVKASPPEGYSKDLIDWTAASGRFDVILRDDLKTYIAAKGLTVVPTPSTDYLTISGNKYRVVKSNLVWSGDQVALYEVQLRF